MNGKLPNDLQRPILRAVVTDDDLEIEIVAATERREAAADAWLGVERTDDDRNPGPALAHVGDTALTPGPHRIEGRLRPPLGVGDAEAPSVDGLASDGPLVRPVEDDRACAAGLVCEPQLPFEA